jgi:hypothetical protein
MAVALSHRLQSAMPTIGAMSAIGARRRPRSRRPCDAIGTIVEGNPTCPPKKAKVAMPTPSLAQGRCFLSGIFAVTVGIGGAKICPCVA